MKHIEKEELFRILDNKIQLIIDLGFDYDGLNTVKSLKDLIDELVRYAEDCKTIIKELKKH